MKVRQRMFLVSTLIGVSIWGANSQASVPELTRIVEIQSSKDIPDSKKTVQLLFFSDRTVTYRVATQVDGGLQKYWYPSGRVRFEFEQIAKVISTGVYRDRRTGKRHEVTGVVVIMVGLIATCLTVEIPPLATALFISSTSIGGLNLYRGGSLVNEAARKERLGQWIERNKEAKHFLIRTDERLNSIIRSTFNVFDPSALKSYALEGELEAIQLK